MTVKGRKLIKRAVISLNEAAEIGRIDNIFFDRDARMAAFVIKRRSDDKDEGVAATSIANVHAIGRDVITLEDEEHVAGEEKVAELQNFPNLLQLVGCRVITEGGIYLGIVRDILLDTERRVITDFELAGRGVIGHLRGDTIPATGHLRFGKEIVIVPNSVALKGRARLEPIEEHSAPAVTLEVVTKPVQLPRTAEQPSTAGASGGNHEEEGLTRALGE